MEGFFFGVWCFSILILLTRIVQHLERLIVILARPPPAERAPGYPPDYQPGS